jgi:hypothetical protein
MKTYDIISESGLKLTLQAANQFDRDFDEIIFDNEDASARFSLKTGEAVKAAKLPYQDIQKFAIRKEIEYQNTSRGINHNDGHIHRSQNYYLVYLIKKDGGILDLNYFNDEPKATEFLQKLEIFVQLNNVCKNPMNPEKYSGFEVSSLTGPIEIKWKNISAGKNMARLIIPLLILGGIGYGMSFLPSEVLNSGIFILFVSILGIIILLFIVLMFVVRGMLGKKGRVAGPGGNYIVSIDSKELSLIHEKNENRTVINKVNINNIYGVYSSCYSNPKHDYSKIGVTTKEGLKNMYLFNGALENTSGSIDTRGLLEKFETMINNDENFSFEAPGMDMIDKMHFENLLQKYIKDKSGLEVL